MTAINWMDLEAEYRQEATADFSTGDVVGSKRAITLDHGLALMREAFGVTQDALGNLRDAERPGRNAEMLAEYARRAKEYSLRLRVLSQLVNDRGFLLNPALGTQGEYDSNQGLPEVVPDLAHMAEKAKDTIIARWTATVRSEAGF